jgi:glycosyltransferase involved in cell wall biosynthesis
VRGKLGLKPVGFLWGRSSRRSILPRRARNSRGTHRFSCFSRRARWGEPDPRIDSLDLGSIRARRYDPLSTVLSEQRPMRLIIDGRRLTAERTGVGRYLEGLLEEWALTGPPLPETIVVLHDEAGRDRIPSSPKIGAQVVGRSWPGLVWERFGLASVLQRGDILFAPTNLIPANWHGPSVLVMFDTLQEVRPGDFPWHVRWRFGARYRRAARQADHVVVPSEATANDVRRHYDVSPTRIHRIPPAPGPEFAPHGPKSEEVQRARQDVGLGEAPFFLFVGKRSRRRNIPAILSGFARFRADYPDSRLVFVGPRGDDITEGGEIPGILDAGHVSEPVLRGLLAGALALLYPSEYEGFGLPVVEAMASGCPVITLRNSALEEAGGAAAYYLPAPTLEAMSEALRIVASDAVIRSEFVRLGLTHVQHWTRAQFAERVKDVIVSVAELSHSSGRRARERDSATQRATTPSPSTT